MFVRVCFYRVVSSESFDSAQIKMTLNLVNNFIRDWSEKRSKSYPLRVCRFCDRAITETTRQWVRNIKYKIFE